MFADRVRLARIAAALVVLAVAAASWLVVLAPRMSTAGELQEQAEQVELANLALLTRQRQITDLAKTLPQRAAEAQALFAQMPQTAQLPEVLTQIGDAALAAGIRPEGVTVLTTTIPVSVADGARGDDTAAAAQGLGVQLATMVVDVTVTGTDAQLAGFLDNLQAMERVLLITSTGVTTGATEGRPTASLSVQGTMFVLESALPDLVANAERIVAETLPS